MLRISRTKIVLTLATILVGLLLGVPSLMTKEQREGLRAAAPSWVPSWMLPTRAIVLGLDLQGGSYLLIEVDQQDLVRSQSTQLRDDVRRILRETGVVADGGIQLTPRGVQVRISDPAARAKVLPRLNDLAQPITNPILGQTGARSLEVRDAGDGLLQLGLTEEGLRERIRRASEQSIEVIRRRIDPTGTTEANIQRQGAGRILLEVPGEQNPQRLKDLVGRTAKLEFRMLAEPGATDVDMLASRDAGGQRVAVERRVVVSGDQLVDASPSFDQRTNEPIVNFRFNVAGGQRFGQVTTENVGRSLAIVLDEEVISAPRILSPITGGSGQISGRFTVEAANDLALLLRSGALPAKLTVIEERTVGPGLGADSIEAGRTATYIAALLVCGLMFAVYGLFGFIANLALIVHIGLIFGIMSAMQATLTLPGIAGIVLTIGTAVDSNVLIYERMREEVRSGRSIVSAVEAGFNRAFATILDSNVTTLIAALILFLVGSGPIRGFALTLVIGILTTVITAVTLTRILIALWYRTARPRQLPF